jgi:ABC-type sugar transport system permease subunit
MADAGILIKHKKRINWSNVIFSSLFLIPALALLFIFMFYPIIETFRISATKATGIGGEEYVGFQNYARLLKNDDFIASFIHVFQWAFWSIVIQIPLAFFIAYACSIFKSKLMKTLKSIFYMANFIPMAIIAMIGLFIFMPNVGAIATLSKTLGWKWLENIDFLGGQNVAFWTCFFMATWVYIGFYIVYLMANIDQIPVEIREAAIIDGANKWQYARYIVIPHISFPLQILVLLSAIGSFKVFELPWLMCVGGPGNATETLVMFLYKEGFLNWQYGRGAAVGVVIFALCLVFTVVQFSIQRGAKD